MDQRGARAVCADREVLEQRFAAEVDERDLAAAIASEGGERGGGASKRCVEFGIDAGLLLLAYGVQMTLFV